MSDLRTGEEGSASGFVAVVAFALVMVAGMAYDGGQILAAQASARDLAANAARAGAQEVDLTSLRSSGVALLDPARATAAVSDYLAETGHPGAGRVTVAEDTVTVRVEVRQQMRILPLGDRTVVAVDRASALPGLHGGEQP